MALKTFRPTTPSLRQLVQVDRSQLWKGAPIKLLTEGKTKSGGRNNYGRITTRHVGGGHKQAYRHVDFKRGKDGVPASAITAEGVGDTNLRVQAGAGVREPQNRRVEIVIR